MPLAKAGRALSITLPLLLMVALSNCSRSPESKAARFLENGKKYRESHDYGRASIEFRNASQAMPKDAEPYYQLALLALDQGNAPLAVTYLRRATALNPNHRAAQIKLAELMAGTNDKDLLERANIEAKNLVAAAPKDPEALNLLAMTDLKLQKPREAVQLLEEALRQLPADFKAAGNLAAIKLAQKDFPGAEKVLRDLQAANPKSPKTAVALGRFFWMTKKLDQARQQFQRAAEMDPNDASVLRNLAELARARGQQQEAAEAYQRLSKMPPAENRTLYPLYLLEVGRAGEAVNEFERLVKADPSDRQSRSLLVTLDVRLSRANDAQRVLADALKRNPKDSEALLQRAQLRLAERKLDQAEDDAQQVLRLAPNSATAHYVMGVLLRIRGRLGYARQEWTEALKRDPLLLPARIALVESIFALNSAQSALAVINETPQFQRTDPELLVLRNWALMGTGNWTELRRSLDNQLPILQNNSELLLQDGIWKVHQKNFREGEKSLAEALELNPDDTRPLQVIAGISMAQNQPALALHKVTEYADKYPKRAAIQEFLGEWLLASGNPAQAKSVFAAVKAINPNYLPAEMSLARSELAEGRLEDAKKQLSALRNSPQVGAKANLLLGTLEEQGGNTAAAMADYRAALAIEPDNAMALNNMAYLMGNTDESLDSALQYAKRAKDLAPENGAIADTLGWLLFRKGLYDQSVQELENAVRTLHTAAPKYHLSMAYSKTRRPDRAEQLLKDALKQDPNAPEATLAANVVYGGRR